MLITFAIAVILPVYSFYYIFPQFDKQLKVYAEDASIRAATHLKGSVFVKGTDLNEKTFSEQVVNDIFLLMKDLRIEKIKIFSDSGIVLFSSQPEDIGKKNKYDYFYNQVALGKVLSKVVKKNTTTLEGRLVGKEVVESYIPLMEGGSFKGAVEVYYDITENSQTLKALFSRLGLVICIFSFTILILFSIILYKASQGFLVRQEVDKSLKKARSELEQIVADRTNDLKKINLSLLHEIEERNQAEISLQRSYDTQRVLNKLLRDSLGDAELDDLINSCLDMLLSLPWLAFESMGCIFLVGEEPDVLVMKAQRGFSPDLEKVCARVPFGKCLCGRAALKQKTVFASNIDERHDILLPGTPDHGHYCVPLAAKGEILGVINIYVEPDHVRNKNEEEFLKAVANTLSGILIQRYSEMRKREIEKRLHQSQKMESIGTLAGGISHDFNNILSAIFGHAQLAEMNLDDPEKAKNHIDQINKGAKRASDLIQQILTFSRQTDHEKKSFRLCLIVKEAIKFLRSSIPVDIKIIEQISSRAKVKADPTQIHQIVMNLCTNAYHSIQAQEKSGEIFVGLSETGSLKKNSIPGLRVTPGSYLKLEIRDNGSGIPPEMINKIFEPYFTTKQMGEGTGLGLAVVLGIIEEHDGYIDVQSKIGEGSSFHVYLPVLEDINLADDSEQVDGEVTGGSERIMVVDDEESILSSSTELLEDYGYVVKSFLDPGQAFETFKSDPGEFDLIISDMTMPHMSGDVFARKILKIRKDIPIILCTGYSNKLSKDQALSLGVKQYLQKPISINEMLSQVREILDESCL